MLQRFWSWISRPAGRSGVRPGLVALYLLSAGWLLLKVSAFYLPPYGFTYLLYVGDLPENRVNWGEERGLDVFRHEDSRGYDGQSYAQLATDPTLRDPILRESIDYLPYRARRILFSWTAWLLGLGQAEWALNAYALQNVLSWCLLGWLLVRWFPPTNLDRAFRWLGVMLSVGLLYSVFFALLDGPSLLLLALALKWLEDGRRWPATAVLALGGLAKETNLLGAAGLSPTDWQKGRGWAAAVGRMALLALPLLLWIIALGRMFPDLGQIVGVGNFTWPFLAYWERWTDLMRWAASDDATWRYISVTFAAQISLTVQVLFILTRWRWRETAWRWAAPFAGLALVMGPAVWEGYPGASVRVLLPLLLGFNLLVPAGKRWWPVLLLGNLTLFCGPGFFRPPITDFQTLAITNPSGLSPAQPDDSFQFGFNQSWYGVERSGGRRWRWSEDDAPIIVHNPFAVSAEIEIRGRWAAETGRTAYLRLDDAVLWSEPVGPEPSDWQVTGVVVPPGDSELWMTSDQPPVTVPPDTRPLAIRLLQFDVTVRVPAEE